MCEVCKDSACEMSFTAPTLREKSTWTPKNCAPVDEKIFEERMALIKKWYSAWSESQRWTLIQFALERLSDDQLVFIHGLLHPLVPRPRPLLDPTAVLPRCLSLLVFSYLDPRSLCRAAQVSWYWNYLTEENVIWKRKCLRRGWFLPEPPLLCDCKAWKRHYVDCVRQLHWKPPQSPVGVSPLASDEEEEEEDTHNKAGRVGWLTHRRRGRGRGQGAGLLLEGRRPWRDPDRHPEDLKRSTVYMCSSSPLDSTYPTTGTSTTHVHQCLEQNTRSRYRYTTPPPEDLWPTDLQQCHTVHPTLIEKKRLGSPTEKQISFSTVNSPVDRKTVQAVMQKSPDYLR